jgi:hypothetical protein
VNIAKLPELMRRMFCAKHEAIGSRYAHLRLTSLEPCMRMMSGSTSAITTPMPSPTSKVRRREG